MRISLEHFISADYIRFVIVLLALTVSATSAIADPNVLTVTQPATTYTITGSNFGTKDRSTPFYYSNFDTESIGQLPQGQISNVAYGTVQSNLSRSGNKSLEFDYCADAGSINWSSTTTFKPNQVAKYNTTEYSTLSAVGPSSLTPPIDTDHFQQGRPAPFCTNGNKQGDWKRNAIDFGSAGVDKIFMSVWLYLDKGSSTSTSWQWKNFIATSNPNLYASLNTSETVVFFEPWFYTTSTTTKWGNTGSPHVYYWDFNQGKSVLSSTTTAPEDAYLWGQWQRVELYLQRSSAGGVADGIVYFNRVGRSQPLVMKTNAVTHVTGDSPWRYLDFSNGIASIYDGYVKLTVYMDDLYVDTTQARVEVCDSSTWSARTHCEIQPTASWADNTIVANMNSGTFVKDQSVYLYVIDSKGVANSSGFKVTIKLPTAPANLRGTKQN